MIQCRENHRYIFLVWGRHLAFIDHRIPHTTGWWGQQHLLYLQETFHQFNMGTRHHFFRAIINIVCEIIYLRDCWHSSKSFENSNSTSIQNTNKFYITKYKHMLNNHLTLFILTKNYIWKWNLLKIIFELLMITQPIPDDLTTTHSWTGNRVENTVNLQIQNLNYEKIDCI